ncbi:MAG TPA: murein L,D-transpeptidase catalytic domain family protein [Puia sp.]|nr:murein L,D-transpeptidase catalytic domain family protein [Puia sp.]
MKNIFLFIALFCLVGVSRLSAKDIKRNHKNHPPRSIHSAANPVYDSLSLDQFGLSRKVFEFALKGWQQLKAAGRILNENIISIVDFSQPSNKKRLYIIDLANAKLLFNTYVAHGRHSGTLVPTKFSNRPRSLESSVGFYVTSDTYMGSNGYSLKLSGLESGINNNAAKREIVVHGADYVSEQYISANGYLGRSWGCPAVPLDESRDIIDAIKNGSCLFIYSPQNSYLSRSRILNRKA